jgi:hypothetical protein
MDCSDAGVDFCTARKCLLKLDKIKQQPAKLSTNMGRKRAQQHPPQAEEEKSAASEAVAVVVPKKRKLKKVEMPGN